MRNELSERLGIEVPIFLAGMGGVAYAELCAAVSEAGGYGTLGMAAEPPERIREEMRAVRARTDAPFGVDLLSALPDAMLAAIDVIIDEGASAFIAGLGVPGPVIQRCHDAGLLVFSMCGKPSHAVAAAEAGCDVVVAQGTEAGGHTGRIASFALLPQIVDAVDIPVLAAGAIVDGRGVAAALALGAQGAWIGTRFIASTEARAAAAYKQRITEIGGADTTVSRGYSGKPMRVIRNDYTDEIERHPERVLPFPDMMAESVRKGVLNVMLGDNDALDVSRDCLPAGQGAGGIDRVLSCREIIDELVGGAREALATASEISAR
jgi:enoyl-[acyl-carrier protein] reductase II